LVKKVIMNLFKNKYLNLVILHVIIGIAIYIFPFFAKIYGLLIIIIGFIFVVLNKNNNNQVLIVAAYIVGSEAMLRMTSGTISYEFSKYGVILFCILGMYFSGFSKNAIPFWIYILLLLPGLVIATDTLNYATDIRKTIAFNISGPICLGIASIYTYQRNITFKTFNQVFLSCGLPIISTIVYLILYTPDLKDVLISTGSNFATSGGFGPNQVATILGLGMFIFFSRFLFESKNKLLFIVNVVLFLFITFRGLITFSRGGMITGLIMIIVLVGMIYINSKNIGKSKINILIVFMAFLAISIWTYTSVTTDGLIDKRYANQDIKGRERGSQLSGREEILEDELSLFMENPIFGVGVAKGAELRQDMTGVFAASHNELTRTLAEHGALGIVALFILFLTPLFLFMENKQNIYAFSCVLFWLLTINHAAMRLAAPAFIYSLSLLKVTINEEDSLHRK
jgi:hypothetical protein